MEKKSLKIQVPEGYEIDEEESSFENIVFKKKQEIKRWKDLEAIGGYYISNISDICSTYNCPKTIDKQNVYATEKQAKSALAFAQITQLLPYYEGHIDFRYKENNYSVVYDPDTKDLAIYCWKHISVSQFYFSTFEFAEEFIKNNEDLLRQYFMLDKK